MMEMPELVPEKYEEIYKYFRDFEPNKRLQDFGFAVMHSLYKSEVHYTDESSQTIQDHLADGGSLILSPNHQSNADTPTIAGLACEDTFAAIKGTTIIPAKADMFGWPILGKFFPHMMAHPVFRSKDFSDDTNGRLLRNEVVNNLINFNIDHINKGGNIAIFPEATRNKVNPSEVRKLKKGIGRIAVGVDDPSKLLIATMGFAYRLKHLKLRPLVVIGEPFSPTGMVQDEVLEETRRRMQIATTEAFELAG